MEEGVGSPLRNPAVVEQQHTASCREAVGLELVKLAEAGVPIGDEAAVQICEAVQGGHLAVRDVKPAEGQGHKAAVDGPDPALGHAEPHQLGNP